MAKTKDSKDKKKRMPSPVEVGIFLAGILVMILIALPFYINIMGPTAELDTCLKRQDLVNQKIAEFKQQNGKSANYIITYDELASMFPDGEIPVCPNKTKGGVLFNTSTGTAYCPSGYHTRKVVELPKVTPTPLL